MGKLLALKGLNIRPAPGTIPLPVVAHVRVLGEQPLVMPAAGFSFIATVHKTRVHLRVPLLQEHCNLFIPIPRDANRASPLATLFPADLSSTHRLSPRQNQWQIYRLTMI